MQLFFLPCTVQKLYFYRLQVKLLTLLPIQHLKQTEVCFFVSLFFVFACSRPGGGRVTQVKWLYCHQNDTSLCSQKQLQGLAASLPIEGEKWRKDSDFHIFSNLPFRVLASTESYKTPTHRKDWGISHYAANQVANLWREGKLFAKEKWFLEQMISTHQAYLQVYLQVHLQVHLQYPLQWVGPLHPSLTRILMFSNLHMTEAEF